MAHHVEHLRAAVPPPAFAHEFRVDRLGSLKIELRQPVKARFERLRLENIVQSPLLAQLLGFLRDECIQGSFDRFKSCGRVHVRFYHVSERIKLFEFLRCQAHPSRPLLVHGCAILMERSELVNP